MIQHICSQFCAVYQRLADEISWLDESKTPQSDLSAREKITHTGDLIPLEYGEWDQIITQINLKIAAARQLPRDANREKELTIYSEASQHCLFMKDIWRNTVSHARKTYIGKEAVAAMERVRDFMRFLAEGMK
jgi:hypothetical protein